MTDWLFEQAQQFLVDAVTGGNWERLLLLVVAATNTLVWSWVSVRGTTRTALRLTRWAFTPTPPPPAPPASELCRVLLEKMGDVATAEWDEATMRLHFPKLIVACSGGANWWNVEQIVTAIGTPVDLRDMPVDEITKLRDRANEVIELAKERYRQQRTRAVLRDLEYAIECPRSHDPVPLVAQHPHPLSGGGMQVVHAGARPATNAQAKK